MSVVNVNLYGHKGELFYFYIGNPNVQTKCTIHHQMCRLCSDVSKFQGRFLGIGAEAAPQKGN